MRYQHTLIMQYTELSYKLCI